MADKIIRVLAKDAPVKASAITAKEMVERARQIHKTLPVATAALGRSLMAASMMGNQLKEKDGSVTLRIKGGGPLGGITVVSDSQGNARGYVVNPLVDLPLKGPPSWMWAAPWAGRLPHCHQGSVHEGALCGHCPPGIRRDRRGYYLLLC